MLFKSWYLNCRLWRLQNERILVCSFVSTAELNTRDSLKLCRFLWPLMDIPLQFYWMSYLSVQYCAFSAHELKAEFYLFPSMFGLNEDLWRAVKMLYQCQPVLVPMHMHVCMHVFVKIFLYWISWPQKVSFWQCILRFPIEV